VFFELAAVVWGAVVAGLGAAVVVATAALVIVAVVERPRFNTLPDPAADGTTIAARRSAPLRAAMVLAIASIVLGSLALTAWFIATVSPIPHIASTVGFVLGASSFRRNALQNPLPYLGAGISVVALGVSLFLSVMAASCTGLSCGLNEEARHTHAHRSARVRLRRR
jgi:hypothetical protein